ncbi:MAG TPA: hypothetical protein VJA16_10650 [Thermoanaerobaculia bacterium]
MNWARRPAAGPARSKVDDSVRLARHPPLAKPLLELSKCPDLVVNRGHYFGTSYFQEEPGLSDDDKRALIELLKRF